MELQTLLKTQSLVPRLQSLADGVDRLALLSQSNPGTGEDAFKLV